MRSRLYMQISIATGVLVTVPAFAGGVSAPQQLRQEIEAVGPAVFTGSGYKPGLIRHIVLFRYHSTTTSTQRQEIQRRLLSLKANARRQGRTYIQSIESGSQLSGEGADGGMEWAFVITFCSQGDRNYYVGSPLIDDASYYDAAHAAFKRFVAPFVERVIVFDYATNGSICKISHR